jgi:diacylglycerol O-acyltransferase / trehalose O-mycolyltransferase
MIVALLVALCLPGCTDTSAPRTAGPEPAVIGALAVTDERLVDPRMHDLTINSPAVGRAVRVRLFTPDGWEGRRPGQRWPVLYLLHGCCDDYTSWTRETDVEELPALRRVLVVMPDGGDVGFYSDWWNAGGGGPPRWETFHLRELRGLLENKYGGGSRRAIAGLSMGGFGALSYAARNPGMFRAAASYSGLVHTRYQPSGPGNIRGLLEREGADPDDLWGDPVAQESIWREHNPYDLAPRLRSIPVFVSAGNGQPGPFDRPEMTDEWGEQILGAQAHALVDRLRQVGVRVHAHLYGPGLHRWPYWERELHESLPLLLGLP